MTVDATEIEKSYSIEQYHAEMLKELTKLRQIADSTNDFIHKKVYASTLTMYLMYLQGVIGVYQFSAKYIYENALKYDFFAVIAEFHKRLGLVPTRVYVTPTSVLGFIANKFNKLKARESTESNVTE
jgi:hypothetical protein